MVISAPPSAPRGIYDGVPIATAMAVVNVIPQVCAAPPGVLSLLDLRPFPSKITSYQ
jgi:2,4-diaminopentanoate dehydrogenase